VSPRAICWEWCPRFGAGYRAEAGAIAARAAASGNGLYLPPAAAPRVFFLALALEYRLFEERAGEVASQSFRLLTIALVLTLGEITALLALFERPTRLHEPSFSLRSPGV